MLGEKCYFKRICDTESQEGLAYLNRFIIDIKNCRECLGYVGFGHCEHHLTKQQAENGGLIGLMKKE